MIARNNQPMRHLRCCPECGGSDWERRKQRRPAMLDCQQCGAAIRMYDTLCPSPEQIAAMRVEAMRARAADCPDRLAMEHGLNHDA